MAATPRSQPMRSFWLAFGQLFLFLLIISASPVAAATPLVLRDGVDSYPLRGPSLDILEDPGGKLTINKVASPEMAARFTPCRQQIPNFGFSHSAFWLRFTLDDHSRQPQQWLLRLGTFTMNLLDLYIPRAGGGFEVERSGTLRPMSSWKIQNRLIVLPLGNGPSRRTFYLRGWNQGRINFPLNILSPQALAQKDQESAYVFGAYTGLLTAMAISGLLLFFFLRDRSYLYYVWVVLSTLLFMLMLNGYLYEFVLPERPLLHDYAGRLISVLPILSSYIFVRTFLQTDRRAPRHDRLLRYLIYFDLLLLPLVFLLPPTIFRNLLNLNLLAATVVNFSAAIICVHRGYHPARYYLASRLVLWITCQWFFLENAGLESFWFTGTYPLMIANVFDFILLSMALIDRINVIQQEKEQAEAEVRRASQLAHLGELAAGIAHEVNTPINTIINTSDFLTDDNQEELEHDAAIIKSEGRRIAGIVGGLLSFARRGQGDKTACQVARIVTDIVCLVQAKLRKDHILLQVEVPEDLPDIKANHQQMLQVVLNLINNAAQGLNEKYTGPHADKLIRLVGEKVETKDGLRVRLSFHDHGPGIPAQLLDQVVKPFFTTKAPGQGTGLGLSVAHGIIHEHCGNLRLSSIEGASTTVSIELPLVEQS